MQEDIGGVSMPVVRPGGPERRGGRGGRVLVGVDMTAKG